MNTNYQQERDLYKKFLQTSKGRECLTDAVKIMKEWREGKLEVCISTCYVKEQLLPLRDRVKKIEINPIGLNNHCHSNSKLFEELGYESVLGFNITACPCGKRMSFEIHTVNKKGDKLYDFTRDFNDEKEKYFLGLNNKHITAHQYVSLFGYEPYTINKGCDCNLRWKNMKEFEIAEDKLIKRIEMLDNVRIY
jgi:hypothetical protein